MLRPLSIVLLLLSGLSFGCNREPYSEPLVHTDVDTTPMNKEKVKQLIWDLEGEINNGGFHQFFFNSAGDETEATITALESIGAAHTVRIVREAAAKFPGGMPLANREERQAQLDVVAPETDEFDDLDAAFLEYKDDLQALVDAHQR